MKIFYGNGTAKLVKHSWRDYPEVLFRLGSHLLILLIISLEDNVKIFIETKKTLKKKNLILLFYQIVNQKLRYTLK